MRGLFSAWGHLTILLGGWLTGKVFGIIYISIPLIILYYYVLYRLAEMIIPASDPDDPKEKRQRFNTLVHYMWGIQFPIYMVTEPTSTSAKARISGNVFQNTIGKPGYIWTNPHQVVGTTTGTSFSRVEGPGAIYTGPAELPLEVVDLRTQLRTTKIEVLTQDGIPIKATVFASFCIDKEPWDRDRYIRLKLANPLLQGGMEPDCGEGNFRYSNARVRAVLGIGGVKTTTAGPTKDSSIRWDEQVMNVIGETARHVVSEIPLSELWQPNPQVDEKGMSALDLIATEISNRVSGLLQENGIQLFAARVVNYFLLDDNPDNEVDEITQQQLPAWQARWEREVNLRIAEADAEVEQKLLDASVVARSMFIKATAQALDKNKITGKDLNRYLIALRILIAFDDKGEEKNKIGRDPVSLLRSIFSQSKKR